MEALPEVAVIDPSSRDSRSRRRWLISLVLLVAAISFGSLLRPRNEEGQWLAGHWKRLETYNISQFEHDWEFEPQGRFSRTIRFTKTGKTPTTQTFTGRWAVREGLLSIRIDRPVLRSLAHAGHQAHVAVENAVTGSKAKLVDTDFSKGTVVQLSPDRFTVTWIDPVAPDKLQTPQTWSRVP